jgi:hypothetical protein
MHCTQCGAPGTGRFCGQCGASLVDLPCAACGTELAPGTRFCNDCGTPHRAEEVLAGERRAAAGAGAGAGGGAAQFLPWGVAGVLLVALMVVGGMSILGSGSGPVVQGGQGAAGPGALGPAPNVDLASMTPGEAAWRLFNRVAQALEARDTVEVENFLPMAIDAHEIARPLDDLELFRLSFLYRVASDPGAALTVALEGLERSPNHLLLLSAAAEAHRESGDEEAARVHFARLLEVWEEERVRGEEEYEQFGRLLPVLREEAEAYLAR